MLFRVVVAPAALADESRSKQSLGGSRNELGPSEAPDVLAL